MHRYLIFLLASLMSFSTYSWNAQGHQLVAQIAYTHLSPQAKKLANQYLLAVSHSSQHHIFVRSATWLDAIRAKDIHWYDSFHYIDIPFSNEQIAMPEVAEINALSAIKSAVAVLKSNKTSDADKGLSLRILIHVIGDIHQPLHTVVRVTAQYPKGDAGGNFFLLAKNSVGDNLHHYWDNGGGLLLGHYSMNKIKIKAKQFDRNTGCADANKEKSPEQWVHASHQLALDLVYKLPENSVPDKKYQLMTQQNTERQIALAGCRLAMTLNNLL